MERASGLPPDWPDLLIFYINIVLVHNESVVFCVPFYPVCYVVCLREGLMIIDVWHRDVLWSLGDEVSLMSLCPPHTLVTSPLFQHLLLSDIIYGAFGASDTTEKLVPSCCKNSCFDLVPKYCLLLWHHLVMSQQERCSGSPPFHTPPIRDKDGWFHCRNIVKIKLISWVLTF